MTRPTPSELIYNYPRLSVTRRLREIDVIRRDTATFRHLFATLRIASGVEPTLSIHAIRRAENEDTATLVVVSREGLRALSVGAVAPDDVKDLAKTTVGILVAFSGLDSESQRDLRVVGLADDFVNPTDPNVLDNNQALEAAQAKGEDIKDVLAVGRFVFGFEA